MQSFQELRWITYPPRRTVDGFGLLSSGIRAHNRWCFLGSGPVRADKPKMKQRTPAKPATPSRSGAVRRQRPRPRPAIPQQYKMTRHLRFASWYDSWFEIPYFHAVPLRCPGGFGSDRAGPATTLPHSPTHWPLPTSWQWSCMLSLRVAKSAGDPRYIVFERLTSKSTRPSAQ